MQDAQKHIHIYVCLVIAEKQKEKDDCVSNLI